MTISCNQLLVRLGPRRGLKGFLGRRGRQCPAPISPDGRILAEVAPSSAEVEHAVDQAIGDSHCDGLWRYDPATRPISVYVLVCQAALIRDPRPELAESARSASVAAALGLLAEGRSKQDRMTGGTAAVNQVAMLTFEGALVRPSLAGTASDARVGGNGGSAAWRERCLGHVRPAAAAPATTAPAAGAG